MNITVVILASNFENMNYDCSKLAKKKKNATGWTAAGQNI